MINNVFLRTQTNDYIFQNGTCNDGAIRIDGGRLSGGGTYFNVTPPALQGGQRSYNVRLQQGVKYVLGTTSTSPSDSWSVPTCEVNYLSGGHSGSDIRLKKAKDSF